jgi:hypothetical protein
MSLEKKIGELGEQFDAKWSEVERLTAEAIDGRRPLDTVFEAIREASECEARLRCEQVRHAAESMQTGGSAQAI